MSQPLPVTFGNAEAFLEVGGFRVTEAAYAANARLPRHEHQFASWTAVLDGGLEERFREGTYTCRTGALLAKPASATHSNEYGDTGARVVIVEVTEAAIEAHLELRAITRTAVRMLSSTAVGSRVNRLRSELAASRAEPSLGVHAAILEIALLLLRTQARIRSKRSEWLRRATDRLQAEFVDPPSLSVLAAECGVHPVHLCAAFRSAHGCSPGAFVRRVRLEHAQRLLARTSHSVSQIAFASGFSDQSHLTRQFRAAIGLTPAAYRRRASARDGSA